MLRKIIVVTTSLTLACSSAAFAQDVDGAKFRSAEEGAWYHPFEPDTLVRSGANEQELYQILTRIERDWRTREPRSARYNSRLWPRQLGF